MPSQNYRKLSDKFPEVEIGIEVGTLQTFFSQENPSLGQVQVSTDEQLIQNNQYTYDVQYPDGHLFISEQVSNLQNKSIRQLTIEPVSDTDLMDAVLRFKIPVANVKQVKLNGTEILFKRQNKYHQSNNPQNISILFKDGRYLTFNPQYQTIPEGMEPLIYVRDEPDYWIVHIRVRSANPDKLCFKGCCSLYNKPFPAIISKPLMSLNWFKQWSLYVRERIGQYRWLFFQTNGATVLKKGDIIKFSVEIIEGVK